MGMIQGIDRASDRVMAALVSGLELEFGNGAGAALAERFLAAEDADFHWEARLRQRWIGSYEGLGDEDFELDRVAIFGRLGRRWFVAMMIVDGDGNAHGMMGRRSFTQRSRALAAFAAA